jgi:pimeloyl-ACP methyl ester carboxylesterase
LLTGCSDTGDEHPGSDGAAGAAGQGGEASDAAAPAPHSDASADAGIRPVVFVHGGFGWASQFESQAQRFMSNGYPRSYLAAYEHDTLGTDPAEQIDPLDEIIDAVLLETGADQVELMGHSRGAGVSFHYLESSPERAAKVAHYVAIDSATGLGLTTGMDRTPGNVEMLALWGEGDPTREVVGATNVHIPTLGHVEAATAAASFVAMYEFFNGKEPATDRITEASGAQVEIGGRVNYFPQNTGALGTLSIFEVNADTGYRVSETAVAEWPIDSSGSWGPQTVDKGAHYEFSFVHATGEVHGIYREPFYADNYFVHLITSPPDGILAHLLARTPDSTFILVQRDMEIWGDQGAGNDVLTVDGTSVATPEVAAREDRLNGLFLMDWGPGAHPQSEPGDIDYGTHTLGESSLDAPIADLHGLPFMSGLDLFIPAASPPDRSVEVKLVSRNGNGAEQVIHVPNWASDEVRMSVSFRDFVR